MPDPTLPIRPSRHAIPMEDRLPLDGTGASVPTMESQTSLRALREDLAGKTNDDNAARLVEQILGEADEDAVTSLPRVRQPKPPRDVTSLKPVGTEDEEDPQGALADQQEGDETPPNEDDEAADKLDEGDEAEKAADADDELEIEIPVAEGETPAKVKLRDLKETYKEAQTLRAQVKEAQDEMEQAPLKVHQAMEEQRGNYVKALQGYQAMLFKLAAPEFEGVDMRALAVNDPAAYVRMQARMQEINGAMQQLQQEEEQQLSAQASESSKARSYAVTRSKAILQKEIKGWNDDTYQTILKGAVKYYGFAPKEVAAIIDPRVIKMANDAAEFNRLKERAAKVKQTVQDKATPKPTLRSGRVTAAKSGERNADSARIAFLRNRNDDNAASFLDSLGIT